MKVDLGAEVSELADGTKLRAGDVTLPLIGFVNSQQTRADIALHARQFILEDKSITITIILRPCQQRNNDDC